MMNVEVIERMEETARTILRLPVEAQNEFYVNLLDIGFTKDEVTNLMKYVSLYRMFTDDRHYREMKQAVATMLWNTFNEDKQKG